MVTHRISAAFGFAAILNVCILLVIIALIRAKLALSRSFSSAPAALRGRRVVASHRVLAYLTAYPPFRGGAR